MAADAVGCVYLKHVFFNCVKMIFCVFTKWHFLISLFHS